ncbi:hypothetical protein evm_000727 [Chilo suppressalis]|nr:hypothetical protein evm_000727 [Chilo suppressalis]
MSSPLLPFCLVIILVGLSYSAPADDKKSSDPQCPENEYYEKCELAQCLKECDHIVNQPPCPSISADCNKPACLCKQGYLRNSDGVCVPYSKCGHRVPWWLYPQ